LYRRPLPQGQRWLRLGAVVLPAGGWKVTAQCYSRMT
jgi:hypothetical protein